MRNTTSLSIGWFQSASARGSVASFALRRAVIRHLVRYGGFTLVEILVVLVIIGITLALVSVNFAKDDRAELRDEAQRLALLYQAARDEAISTGKAVAWVANGPQYGFFHHDADNKWGDAIAEAPFTGQSFAPRITLIDLQVNGAKVPLDTPVVFSSSGMNTPFQATLDIAGERLGIMGDAVGLIQIQRMNDEGK
jgi:general secretion pathway protein H